MNEVKPPKETSTFQKPTPAQYQEWLQVLYSEAWQQYCHEDNLYQTRSTLFIGIEVALIGILSGVSAPLINLDAVQIFSVQVLIGPAVLGFLMCFFAILGIIITKHWENITHAGRAYLSLRLMSARIIEVRSGFDELGIIGIENRWTTWSKMKQTQIAKNRNLWYPSGFSDHSGLEIEIRPRPKNGGFDTHLNLIRILKSIWFFAGLIGAILLISNLWFLL